MYYSYLGVHKINLLHNACFWTKINDARQRLAVMIKKTGLSRQEKIDVLKRLIKKFSSSSLSKQETVYLLKRLMLVIMGRKDASDDPVKVTKDSSGESRGQN